MTSTIKVLSLCIIMFLLTAWGNPPPTPNFCILFINKGWLDTEYCTANYRVNMVVFEYNYATGSRTHSAGGVYSNSSGRTEACMFMPTMGSQWYARQFNLPVFEYLVQDRSTGAVCYRQKIYMNDIDRVPINSRTKTSTKRTAWVHLGDISTCCN